MNNSLRKVQRYSPISSLLDIFQLSERSLHAALEAQAGSEIQSLSNLSRLLKTETLIDTRDIQRIGRIFGPHLNLDPTMAGQALLAEHWLWRQELQEFAAPENSQTPRMPVVRHKEFQSAVQTILKTSPFLLSVTAPNDLQVGRKRFAQAVAQYCAYDSPPSVRRTLKSVTLAQLDSDSQRARPVDLERLVGCISVQLGIARRNGDERDNILVDRIVESIADSFRYLTRPLLLLKDTRGVPDAILRDFVKLLLSKLPLNSKLVVLVTAEAPLLNSEVEFNIAIGNLTAEEMASFIAWKIGTDSSQLPELIGLCEDLKTSIRKPSVASALAGAYLLQTFGHLSPWSFLQRSNTERTSASSESVSAIIRQIVDAATRGRSLDELETAEEMFVALMGKRSAEDMEGLTVFERLFLFSLAIFDGPFSKAAARACSLENEGGWRSQKRNLQFERMLDRLCISGAVICERLSDPVSFSLEADTKTWIREWKSPSGMIPYTKLEYKAKYRYFKYIGREVRTALAQYNQDPHAIDTASREFFARLEPEARQIDLFLTETWSLLEQDETNLPLPTMSNEDLLDWQLLDLYSQQQITAMDPTQQISPELLPGLQDREKRIVWISLLCANLSLFWEAANLAGTAIFHLDKAEKCLGRMITAVQNRGAMTRKIERQVCAIRAQLILSLLCIEVRQRRNGFKSAEWYAELDRAQGYITAADYRYGQALHALLAGMIRNRKNCAVPEQNGVAQMRAAADLAQECSRREKESAYRRWSPRVASDSSTHKQESIATRHSLWMEQYRGPIARYLAFMIQREIGRAQVRSGEHEAALQTYRILLQSSLMARESRLVAEALIALIHAVWFSYIDRDSAQQPLPEEKLSEIRQYLYQMDAYVADLTLDQATLQAHYLTMLGVYHLEKALANRVRPNSEDHLDDRRTFGEELFTTGFAHVTDTHFRGLYFAFVADSYRRFAHVTNDPEILYASQQPPQQQLKKQEKQQGRATPSALAASYMVRSLQELQHEVEQGYVLSQVLKRLFQKLYNQVGERELYAAITMHCAAERRDQLDEREAWRLHADALWRFLQTSILDRPAS